jgi:hypothetical protein
MMRRLQEFDIAGLSYLAGDQAQAQAMHDAQTPDERRTWHRSASGRPAREASAHGGIEENQPSIRAEDIYARRRAHSQANPDERPIEGEGVYARRARQVRSARMNAAPDVDQTAAILSPEYAANIYASRRKSPGVPQ